MSILDIRREGEIRGPRSYMVDVEDVLVARECEMQRGGRRNFEETVRL